MTGEPVDYYDVQAAIRDARSEIRGEIDREVSRVRDELHAEASDLRAGVAALRLELAAHLLEHAQPLELETEAAGDGG